MHYVTKGTCSRAIDFDVVDGKVTNTKFTMGCMGNTQMFIQEIKMNRQL